MDIIQIQQAVYIRLRYTLPFWHVADIFPLMIKAKHIFAFCFIDLKKEFALLIIFQNYI